MFGLAVLFGVSLWIILTIIATYCGYKIAHKYNHGKLGAFIGFMLLMGGWFVYWTVEYFYIQAKVKHLCETQGGVTVYVTPEEWRKMIGEEEWSKLQKQKKPEENSFDRKKKIFYGNEFTPIAKINQNVIMYSDWQTLNEFASKNIGLLVDQHSQSVLVEYISISAGAGAWLSGGSPKFWLNNLADCQHIREYAQTTLADQYSNLSLENENE